MNEENTSIIAYLIVGFVALSALVAAFLFSPEALLFVASVVMVFVFIATIILVVLPAKRGEL